MPVTSAYRNGGVCGTIHLMEQQIRTSQIQHRRDTLFQLALPMLLLSLLIMAGVVVVALFPRRVQVGVVADWMFTIFMLCPLALCTLPLTLLMIGAVFGLHRAHSAAAQPLRKVTGYSTTLTQRVQSVADQINNRTIDASTRLGWLYRWLGAFEEPIEGKTAHDESTDQPDK